MMLFKYQILPDIFNFVIFLTESVIHLRPKLAEGRICSIKTHLGILEGITCVSQLRSQTVTFTLQLYTDRCELIDLAGQLLDGALCFTQTIYNTYAEKSQMSNLIRLSTYLNLLGTNKISYELIISCSPESLMLGL